MRIVSLLPAATEWICAFGAREHLVGRSHECDYPFDLRDVPVVTRPARLDPDGDSASISAQVEAQLQGGLSLFEVDLDLLKSLEPDLIVTQATCKVCALSLDELERLLGDWTERRPALFSMEPRTLKQVLDTALKLGRVIDCLTEAMHVISRGERRLKQLHEHLEIQRTSAINTFPTLVCIEWLEPLMTASHWMPDLAAEAGLNVLLSTKGERSHTVAWDDLRTTDPDYIAIMPCGFPLGHTERDLRYLTEQPGWSALRAVQAGRVVCFDGNAYFNRPGPRLYRAIELLALAFQPAAANLNAAARRWEMHELATA